MGVEFTTHCAFASILTSPESLVGVEVKHKVWVFVVCGIKISRTTASDTTAKATKNVWHEVVTGLYGVAKIVSEVVYLEKLICFSLSTQSYRSCNRAGSTKDILLKVT